VSRRIDEDVERLLLVVRAVQSHRGSETQRCVLVPLELLDAVNEVVDVELLRYRVVGPGGAGQSLDLLERELACAVRLREHEPVRIIDTPVGRRLVSRSVDEPQELPLELGEFAGPLTVQNGVHVCRVLAHRCFLSFVRARGMEDHYEHNLGGSASAS
jgi:hypothetical protein